MSKAGQNNFSGINKQAQVSLFFFLKNLRDPDFDFIILEDENWEDFTAVYKSEKRIICEVKDWGRALSYSEIKEILKSVNNKKLNLKPKDEVLILCNKISEKFNEDLQTLKAQSHYGKVTVAITKKFKKKGYDDDLLKLLLMLSIETFGERNLDQEITRWLYDYLLFWLPQEEIEQIKKTLLFEHIYQKAEKGATFSCGDFRKELKEFREEKIKNIGTYNKERRKVEAINTDLLNALENPKDYRLTEGHLSALSADPSLMRLAISHILDKQTNIEQLPEEFFEASLKGNYLFSLFDIFKKSFQNHSAFILQFIENHLDQFIDYWYFEFTSDYLLRFMKERLSEYPKQVDLIFEITKEIARKKKDSFRESTYSDSSFHEKRIFSELLIKVYDLYREKKDRKHIEEIVVLISDHFNLIQDDHFYALYTPNQIFAILKDYILLDFSNNFHRVVKIIVDQYQKNHHQNFDGWEWIGSGISRFAHNFSLEDRNFVKLIFMPVIDEYYKNHPRKGWKFIKKHCIKEEKKVSNTKPDFLNRASIPMLIERYKGSREVSQEAYKILKEFILSKKGIPDKAALIFQEIKNSNLDDKKLWKLIQIALEKYEYPLNVFIEQIVFQLARKGHQEAIQGIKKWLDNPEYYKWIKLRSDLIGNLGSLLEETPTNRKLFLELFKKHIHSKYFIEKMDPFEAEETAQLLNKLLLMDLESGLAIIKELWKKKGLTRNQQILICCSLSYHEDEKKYSEEYINKIYQEIFKPILEECECRIDKICKKLSYPYARASLVKFANQFARFNQIERALEIIEIFINDPDPLLPEEDSEEHLQYNLHKSIEEGNSTTVIRTVRGWCAWILEHCIVLKGRDYIPRIIELTEYLALKDPNLYIKHMAIFPLKRLAEVRLCSMPEDENQLFFHPDIEEALKMAKKVEKISFSMVEQILKLPEKPKKILAKDSLYVIGNLRALSQEDALELLNTILKFDEEVIADASRLFIFFAEVRKITYRDWQWVKPGLYDNLSEELFDEKPFKKMLNDLIESKGETIRSKLAFDLSQMVKEIPIKRKKGSWFDLVCKYYKKLITRYEGKTFANIFRFIQDTLSEEFEKCYELWKQCTELEVKAFNNPEAPHQGMLSSMMTHEKILPIIKEKKEEAEFLSSLELLLMYPDYIWLDRLNSHFAALKTLPKNNEKVENIFDRLVKRDPKQYLKMKQEWLETE